MRTRRLCLLIVVAAGVALTASPAAFAHAQLLGTSPASGSTVQAQPMQVIFKFNQNVGGTLGAVRVYDAQGNEVDNLAVSHPDGNEHWMGVGLKSGLPDGTYTATYRVISADTHIVYGGLVFSIGHPGAAPKFTVAGLIGRNRSGKVTAIAFGVVRALDYMTIALMVGAPAFVLFAWLPALAAGGGAEQRRRAAADAFSSRLGKLLAIAVVGGLVVSVLGVLLQGASAAGVSLWGSLKSAIVKNTLESRFGEVWGARAIDWLLIGGLLLAFKVARRRALLVPLALACAYLVITPALAGHASIQSPTELFFPSDALHVLAASVWVGGIACLLLALPGATRQLEGPERSQLLLATLARFSPLALCSVIAIAITGTIQAYIDVRSVEGLLHTTYGAIVIAKTALLATLVGSVGEPRARDPRAEADRRRGPPAGRCGRARAAHDARRAFADAERVRADRRADHLRAADRRGVGAVLDQHHDRAGRARDDGGTGESRVEHDSPVPYRRQDRCAVHGHQGTHCHRPAAVQGNRPSGAEGVAGGSGPLHPQLRRAQPRRHLGHRNRRPDL